ncbi:putative ryanodine receptor type 1 [Blattamonas nauphoetae]|uniref:Ryanodine receptor type 1 n=1 Tax=Blattamonas nauphoetae TaxID=2049346 RepID=A0ABQ9YA27_9EUKA|nr:putative ryanodine receptor type 1 [Blattamonas nauphoetae]
MSSLTLLDSPPVSRRLSSFEGSPHSQSIADFSRSLPNLIASQRDITDHSPGYLMNREFNVYLSWDRTTGTVCCSKDDPNTIALKLAFHTVPEKWMSLYYDTIPHANRLRVIREDVQSAMIDFDGTNPPLDESERRKDPLQLIYVVTAQFLRILSKEAVIPKPSVELVPHLPLGFHTSVTIDSVLFSERQKTCVSLNVHNNLVSLLIQLVRGSCKENTKQFVWEIINLVLRTLSHLTLGSSKSSKRIIHHFTTDPDLQNFVTFLCNPNLANIHFETRKHFLNLMTCSFVSNINLRSSYQDHKKLIQQILSQHKKIAQYITNLDPAPTHEEKTDILDKKQIDFIVNLIFLLLCCCSERVFAHLQSTFQHDTNVLSLITSFDEMDRNEFETEGLFEIPFMNVASLRIIPLPPNLADADDVSPLIHFHLETLCARFSDPSEVIDVESSKGHRISDIFTSFKEHNLPNFLLDCLRIIPSLQGITRPNDKETMNLKNIHTILSFFSNFIAIFLSKNHLKENCNDRNYSVDTLWKMIKETTNPSDKIRIISCAVMLDDTTKPDSSLPLTKHNSTKHSTRYSIYSNLDNDYISLFEVHGDNTMSDSGTAKMDTFYRTMEHLQELLTEDFDTVGKHPYSYTATVVRVLIALSQNDLIQNKLDASNATSIYTFLKDSVRLDDIYEADLVELYIALFSFLILVEQSNIDVESQSILDNLNSPTDSAQSNVTPTQFLKDVPDLFFKAPIILRKLALQLALLQLKKCIILPPIDKEVSEIVKFKTTPSEIVKLKTTLSKFLDTTLSNQTPTPQSSTLDTAFPLATTSAITLPYTLSRSNSKSSITNNKLNRSRSRSRLSLQCELRNSYYRGSHASLIPNVGHSQTEQPIRELTLLLNTLEDDRTREIAPLLVHLGFVEIITELLKIQYKTGYQQLFGLLLSILAQLATDHSLATQTIDLLIPSVFDFLQLLREDFGADILLQFIFTSPKFTESYLAETRITMVTKRLLINLDDSKFFDSLKPDVTPPPSFTLQIQTLSLLTNLSSAEMGDFNEAAQHLILNFFHSSPGYQLFALARAQGLSKNQSPIPKSRKTFFIYYLALLQQVFSGLKLSEEEQRPFTNVDEILRGLHAIKTEQASETPTSSEVQRPENSRHSLRIKIEEKHRELSPTITSPSETILTISEDKLGYITEVLCYPHWLLKHFNQSLQTSKESFIQKKCDLTEHTRVSIALVSSVPKWPHPFFLSRLLAILCNYISPLNESEAESDSEDLVKRQDKAAEANVSTVVLMADKSRNWKDDPFCVEEWRLRLLECLLRDGNDEGQKAVLHNLQRGGEEMDSDSSDHIGDSSLPTDTTQFDNLFKDLFPDSQEEWKTIMTNQVLQNPSKTTKKTNSDKLYLNRIVPSLNLISQQYAQINSDCAKYGIPREFVQRSSEGLRPTIIPSLHALIRKHILLIRKHLENKLSETKWDEVSLEVLPLEIGMQFVQQLCEGHNLEAQLLFHQQPSEDNSIITSMIEYLDYLSQFLTDFLNQQLMASSTLSDSATRWVMHATIFTRALTETIQGPCEKNQKLLCHPSKHRLLHRLLELAPVNQQTLYPTNTPVSKNVSEAESRALAEQTLSPTNAPVSKNVSKAESRDLAERLQNVSIQQDLFAAVLTLVLSIVEGPGGMENVAQLVSTKQDDFDETKDEDDQIGLIERCVREKMNIYGAILLRLRIRFTTQSSYIETKKTIYFLANRLYTFCKYLDEARMCPQLTLVNLDKLERRNHLKWKNKEGGHKLSENEAHDDNIPFLSSDIVRHFEQSIRSIEIQRDNRIQKLFFPTNRVSEMSRDDEKREMILTSVSETTVESHVEFHRQCRVMHTRDHLLFVRSNISKPAEKNIETQVADMLQEQMNGNIEKEKATKRRIASEQALNFRQRAWEIFRTILTLLNHRQVNIFIRVAMNIFNILINIYLIIEDVDQSWLNAGMDNFKTILAIFVCIFTVILLIAQLLTNFVVEAKKKRNLHLWRRYGLNDENEWHEFHSKRSAPPDKPPDPIEHNQQSKKSKDKGQIARIPAWKFHGWFWVYYFLHPMLYLSIIFVASSIMAFWETAFQSILLFDLVLSVHSWHSVLKSIYRSGKNLIVSLLLFLVITYIFSIVASVSFAEVFVKDHALPPTADNQVCHYIITCFIAMIGQFPTGGEWLMWRSMYGESDFQNPLHLRLASFLFTILFWLLTSQIIMNIIQGLIIDTFKNQREKADEAEHRNQQSCFVCGQTIEDLESQGRDMRHHITIEHDPTTYYSYYVHLTEHMKHNLNELNGDEDFMREQFEKASVSYWPVMNDFEKEKRLQHKARREEERKAEETRPNQISEDKHVHELSTENDVTAYQRTLPTKIEEVTALVNIWLANNKHPT